MIRKTYFLLAVILLATGAFAQIQPVFNFAYSNNLEKPAQYEQPETDGTYIYGMTADGGDNFSGAIYKTLPNGSGFSVLHHFAASTATNGDEPMGSLTHVGGVLYGTTFYGGLYNQGTVFKINTNGTGFELLHSFEDADGKNPTCKLVVEAGVIYGTTTGGGQFTTGTIFKLNTNGSGFSTLFEFHQPTTGNEAHSGVIKDGNMLYGTLSYGPSNTSSQGALFAFDLTSSTFSILHEFEYPTGANPFGRVTKIGQILYGLTPYRSWGGGVVYKYDLNTSTYTVIYDGFNYDGGNPYGSFAQDGTMLYFITQGGSYVSSRMFSLNTLADAVTQIFNLESVPNYGTSSHSWGSPLLLNSRLYASVDYGTSQYGYLFGIDTDGSDFEKVTVFKGSSNGKSPQGSLTYAESKLFGMATAGGSNDQGLIFSVNPDGTNYTVLHHFSGYEAWQSYGSLVYEAGVLYGMSTLGGTINKGTMFKVNTDGSGFSIIHQFNGLGGSEPYGSLLVDAGVLYGTTNIGGSNNYGTIFKVNTDGSAFVVLHDFDNVNGGYPACTPIKIGNYLYGTTPEGGINNAGCVFRYNLLTSVYEVLHEFSMAEGAGPQFDLTLEGGKLYGMTNYGGANLYGSIFSLNPDGSAFTVHHHFTYTEVPNPAGALTPKGSDLYGVTRYGGNYSNGSIFKFNIASNILEPVSTFDGSNGTYPTKRLSLIGDSFYGMTNQGGSNNIGTIFKYDFPVQWTGAVNTLWSEPNNWSNGTLPTANNDVVVTSAPANQPHVDALASSPAQCYNLFIKSGAQVTIDPTKALTVTVNVVNEAGTNGLIISSNAAGTGSLIQNNYNVEATIQRYITGNSDLNANHYHFVSIPIETPTLNAGTFMGSYLHEFNPFTQEWVGLGGDPFTPLYCQNGYMVYYPNTSTTYSMSGTLRYGGVQLFTNTINPDNFILLPNPYPSAMDWDHPSWLKSTVYDAIWIWNPLLGNYAAYGSEAGVNNGSNIIPQGQSFFVKAKSPFVNLATAPEVACHDNTAFYKNLLQVQNQLRIKASGNNYSDESIIRFRNDALDGEDEKDVAKVNGNPNAPQLSTWVDGKLFSINTLSIGNTQAEVPLHFESDLTGAVKLDFSQMESFPSTTSIRLFDKNTNQSINIKDQPSYTFTHEPGLNAERFSIVFGQANAMEETNNQGIKLWITDGKLFVNAPEHIGQDALVEIYSSTGQIIESQQIVLSTLNTHQLRSKGLVIARLIANNRVATISGIVL